MLHYQFAHRYRQRRQALSPPPSQPTPAPKKPHRPHRNRVRPFSECALVVEEIQKLMQRSGMTTPELAQAAGVHPNTLYFWFDGTYAPQARTLDAVAAVFGKRVGMVLLP